MPKPKLIIKCFTGSDMKPYLADITRLTVSVFRAYPYLYDASEESEHERAYLNIYHECPDGLAVLVFDGDAVVGASTGIPLAAEPPEVIAPFIGSQYPPESVYYFGESVLLSDYRQRGVGVRFFEEREKHARSLKRFTHTAFAAVERPNTHPLRLLDYVPLNRFWRRRGYEKHFELNTTFTWKETGEAERTPKPMIYWLKDIAEK